MGIKTGELVVRRSIVISAPPERVWQEFESFERMKRWWSTDKPDRKETLSRYEPRLGGAMRMEIESGGQTIRFVCRITAFDPPTELTFELDWPERGWAAPTVVSVRLTPNQYGTLVEISHYGFERIGADALDQFHGFGGGWDLRELESLKAAVEGARV